MMVRSTSPLGRVSFRIVWLMLPDFMSWMSSQPSSFGSSACALAGEADAGEALSGCEHDTVKLVEPGVVFDLLHHRELHAEEGVQFIEGQLDGLEDRQSISTRAWL
jgi:hypothetical protein